MADKLRKNTLMQLQVSLRFGVFVNAKCEPDPEERFARASAAAERIKDDPDTVCGYDGET